MGSLDKGVEDGEYKNKERQRKIKPYLMIFMASLLVSMAGIFVLGWWIYKFHPGNRELWMVPFGLILFLTPVIVGFSLIISEPCVSQKEEEVEEDDENSVIDLMRLSKK